MSKFITKNVIVNAVLFQAVWLSCVVGSAYGLTWPSVVSFAALAIWQLDARRRAASDITLLWVALIMGLVIDTLWIQLGFMDFYTDGPIEGLAPLWIIILWLGFALTINHSLNWLKAHPLLPAAMGLIGGPLSYFAGLEFGAVDYLSDELLISASLGIAWALTMIVLVRISRIPS